MYGGGEAIAETREIKDDEALKTILNLNEVPSESAIGDWLRRMGSREGKFRIKTVNKASGNGRMTSPAR